MPIWSIIQRDFRKYCRNYGLLAYALGLPILQLLVIGYAFGGKIRDLPVALVDLDRNIESLRLRAKFQAVAAGVRTFHVLPETDAGRATARTRQGEVAAAIIIPYGYSRDVLRGRRPQLALVVDNTQLFSTAALTQKVQEIVATVNQIHLAPQAEPGMAPGVMSGPASERAPALASATTLQVVELFPYVEYIQYLLPGAITLAIYASCIISGATLYIDDKNTGVHEGYLAAPVSNLELLTGMVASGTLRGALSGLFVTVAGALLAGIGGLLRPAVLASLLVFNLLTAAALVNLVAVTMMRIRDPLIPRAAFAILNILLFFPSGAIYPVAGFPAWLRTLSAVDPFTYSVHGLRAILLKHAGPAAVSDDILILSGCATLCFLGAWLLFPRRL